MAARLIPRTLARNIKSIWKYFKYELYLISLYTAYECVEIKCV